MIAITGIEEVAEALELIPDRIDLGTVLGDVSHEFSGRLRAATPVGYSGDLQASVMAVHAPGRSVVGYEKGVEVAGGENLRKSVLYRDRSASRKRRWVPAEELETILFDAVGAYARDGVDRMEAGLAKAVDDVRVS